MNAFETLNNHTKGFIGFDISIRVNNLQIRAIKTTEDIIGRDKSIELFQAEKPRLNAGLYYERLNSLTKFLVSSGYSETLIFHSVQIERN